jgi:hypothetical protein
MRAFPSTHMHRHPLADSCMQNIIKAFRQASTLAVDKVKSLSISLVDKSDAEKKDLLKKCAMTTLNSKLVSSCEDQSAGAAGALGGCGASVSSVSH